MSNKQIDAIIEASRTLLRFYDSDCVDMNTRSHEWNQLREVLLDVQDSLVKAGLEAYEAARKARAK